MSTMPDNTAERLCLGDESALAKVFETSRERLRRIVEFRLHPNLRGRLDADDVLQEAYLSAVQRLPHYQADGGLSPFAWCRMVLMQTITDLYRHHLGAQKRDARLELNPQALNDMQNTATSMVFQLRGDLTSPTQAAARADAIAAVKAAIETMSDLDRDVLVLRHFEELSNQETAEVLGIQPKAASIRYVRALRRLRVVLAEISEFAGRGT
jgi:RNA polymerase sigma-70 factor (ECF subfamily)